MDRHRLHELVELARAAATGHDEWTPCLQLLAATVGGTRARLVAIAARRTVSFVHRADIGPAFWVSSVPHRHAAVDAQALWLLGREADRWWHSETLGDVPPPGEAARRHVASSGSAATPWSGLRLVPDAPVECLVVVEGRPVHRPIDADTRVLLRHFGLHLRHALRQEIDARRRQATSPAGRRAIERLPHPALVVNEFDDVTQVNRGAVRLLDRLDRESAGRQATLAALLDDPGVRQALAAARARRTQAEPVRATLARAIDDEHGAVVAQRFEFASAPRRDRGHRVLLRFAPPDARLGVDADALSATFGLTDDERAVVLSLVHGLQAREVAGLDALPVETVGSRLREACLRVGVTAPARVAAALAACGIQAPQAAG